MVELSPGATEDGLAEQVMVGGCGGLMGNGTVQSANWPAFAPSLT